MEEPQVLGTGCAKCKKSAESTEAAARNAGLEHELIEVTGLNQLMAFGVMMTPAPAVDGVVKVVGTVPSADEIRKMLA